MLQLNCTMSKIGVKHFTKYRYVMHAPYQTLYNHCTYQNNIQLVALLLLWQPKNKPNLINNSADMLLAQY